MKQENSQKNNVNKLKKVRKSVCPDCIKPGFESIQGKYLNFTVKSNEEVTATFVCNSAFEGYPGILHGGIISMILDTAMGECMFSQNISALTVELKTRFRHPVLVGCKTIVSAKIIKVSNPLYILEGKIIQNNDIKVTGIGKFLEQPEIASYLEHINNDK